jgi:hypothetical protein
MFVSKSIKLSKHDDYMSPKHVWGDIKHIIPKDKIIWESAYGNGSSGDNLESLGFDVIHKNIDYFNEQPESWDLQITNPPFSIKKQWFTRAKQLNKPFIILCPINILATNYMRELFADEKLQIIIPKKRIHFIKCDKDGKLDEKFNEKSRCSFDSVYYCYKMNLKSDITFL